MKLQYNVNIQKDIVPMFPKTCLVCGRSTTERYAVTGNPKISRLGGFQWLTNQSVKVDVFGHKECIRKLNISSSMRNYALLLSIGLFIFMQFTELNPYIFTPIILVIIGLVLFWIIKFPVPFEVTEIGDLLNFEFKDKKIAEEFAQINNSKVF